MTEDDASDSEEAERIVGGVERPAPPKPDRDSNAPVPAWRKKKKGGALTALEREKIDSLGKKAMSARERRALNLPRPPPRR